MSAELVPKPLNLSRRLSQCEFVDSPCRLGEAVLNKKLRSDSLCCDSSSLGFLCTRVVTLHSKDVNNDEIICPNSCTTTNGQG
jgi:hypothetical protein